MDIVDTINDRDLVIIKLMAQGCSNKEMGGILFERENTVEQHRVRILRRTKCKNGCHLVSWAYQNGLLSVEK